jgi:hypothetical protein
MRITRELTSEEVERRIKEFEKEYGMSFEKFKELFEAQKLDAKFVRSYSEWADLVDTYKGYVEDGELDCISEEIKDFKPEQAALLTPKRIKLLYQLATMRVESTNDLSQKVGRDVKNVHQDLTVLKRFGFVKLNKQKGIALIPETLVKEITFLIH